MIIEDSCAGEIFLLWLWSSLTVCPDCEEQNINPTGLVIFKANMTDTIKQDSEKDMRFALTDLLVLLLI